MSGPRGPSCERGPYEDHLAILTVLREEEIRTAASAFGIRLAHSEPVLAGSVNTNVALRDADGRRFFLRLYEEQDRTGAEREARLLDRLAGEGVATPAPLQRSDGGGALVTLRDKPAAVFPFVAGTHRCQASLSEAECRLVGSALARVHRVGEQLEAGLTAESRFSLAAVEARLSRLPGALPDDVAQARDRLVTHAGELRGARFKAAPIPLIHGDLFRDNVLFTGAEPGLALLDFESASRGQASFDLMVTLLAFSFDAGLRHELARAICGGYAEVRPPSPDELDDLLLAARLACVRFATTRITDYELRPRGVGVYKDFRRWLARLDTVLALGNDGLRSLFQVSG